MLGQAAATVGIHYGEGDFIVPTLTYIPMGSRQPRITALFSGDTAENQNPVTLV